MGKQVLASTRCRTAVHARDVWFCILSLQLFSDFALFQPCTESQGMAFYLPEPCSVLPLRCPSWGLGRLSRQHHYCCSQPALHASPGCEHVPGLLAEVADALLSHRGLRIETKTSPGRKKPHISNCLEVLCIHCPEADNSGWAGFSPVTQGLQLLICWRKMCHSGESITSLWGKHHVILGKTLSTFGCTAWHPRMWQQRNVIAWQERPSENRNMSVLAWKSDSQIFSFTSLTIKFPYSQKGVTVLKAITSISCRCLPLTMCLYCTCFLSGHIVFLTTAIVSRIDTLSGWKFALHPLLNSLVCENHPLNTSLLPRFLISPFSFRSAQSLSSLDPSPAVWFFCLSPVLDPKDLPFLIWSTLPGGQSGCVLSSLVKDAM